MFSHTKRRCKALHTGPPSPASDMSCWNVWMALIVVGTLATTQSAVILKLLQSFWKNEIGHPSFAAMTMPDDPVWFARFADKIYSVSPTQDRILCASISVPVASCPASRAVVFQLSLLVCRTAHVYQRRVVPRTNTATAFFAASAWNSSNRRRRPRTAAVVHAPPTMNLHVCMAKRQPTTVLFFNLSSID